MAESKKLKMAEPEDKRFRMIVAVNLISAVILMLFVSTMLLVVTYSIYGFSLIQFAMTIIFILLFFVIFKMVVKRSII
ncbi:MAG TPA: hypothetical protein VJH34_03555 [archaeon]|nr:hypothetical protein [archaeon]